MPVEPADFNPISDEELWAALAVPAASADNSILAQAFDHARARRFDDANVALGDWHRSLTDHRWLRAHDWAKGGALSAAAVAKLERELQSSCGDPAEWIAQLDATGDVSRIESLVRHVIETRDASCQERLAAFLMTAWDDRDRFFCKRYPFCGQLGGYAHFHLIWWTFMGMLHAGDVPGRVVAAAMKFSLALGRSLHRQAKRYIVHNIFTAGSYALLFISRTCPEFKEADAWARRAIENLDRDFDRSFFSDGGHTERNWGYGCHTIGRLTEAWHFARDTGGMYGHEPHYEEGLRRAYRFYAHTLGPKDIAPGFGDEGLHDLGYILDKALASGVFPEGTSRDLGVDRTRSYNMKGARVAIMRSGGGADDAYANVTYGDFAGWHSHHDLLSMNFWAHGRTLLEEVPRFGSYQHPLDHIAREPQAHNQLLVDGYPYDSRPCVGEDALWHSDDHVDIFSATHRAYRAVPQHEHRPQVASGDLTVRRTIVFVKQPGYAVVIDSVTHDDGGLFNRATSQWWHSPSGFRVLGEGKARTKGRKAVLLCAADSDRIRRIETGIDFTAADMGGFAYKAHAPMHDQWHHLRLRTWDDDGHERGLGFATLLLPFEGTVPDAQITPLPVRGRVPYRADAFEVAVPGRRDVITLNPDRLADAALRGKPIDGRVTVRLGRPRKTITVA